ncbi:MAG: hypothetical protein ACK5NI_00855, partial [bacterium]
MGLSHPKKWNGNLFYLKIFPFLALEGISQYYITFNFQKFGISIDNDTKSLYVAGDSYEIGLLFDRIEQYAV